VVLSIVNWRRFLPYAAAMILAAGYFAAWIVGTALVFALSSGQA
jgi:hypothetical protein